MNKEKLTMREVVKNNKKAGRYWFNKETMEAWNTVIETDIISDGYFITSEELTSGRWFTIRQAKQRGRRIETVSDRFKTLSEAEAKLNEIIETEEMIR